MMQDLNMQVIQAAYKNFAVSLDEMVKEYPFLTEEDHAQLEAMRFHDPVDWARAVIGRVQARELIAIQEAVSSLVSQQMQLAMPDDALDDDWFLKKYALGLTKDHVRACRASLDRRKAQLATADTVADMDVAQMVGD